MKGFGIFVTAAMLYSLVIGSSGCGLSSRRLTTVAGPSLHMSGTSPEADAPPSEARLEEARRRGHDDGYRAAAEQVAKDPDGFLVWGEVPEDCGGYSERGCSLEYILSYKEGFQEYCDLYRSGRPPEAGDEVPAK